MARDGMCSLLMKMLFTPLQRLLRVARSLRDGCCGSQDIPVSRQDAPSKQTEVTSRVIL